MRRHGFLVGFGLGALRSMGRFVRLGAGFGVGLARRAVFCFFVTFFRAGLLAVLVLALTFSIFGAGFVAVLRAGFALAVDFTVVLAVFDVVAAMAVPVKRKAAAVIEAISLFKLVLLLSLKVAPDFHKGSRTGL